MLSVTIPMHDRSLYRTRENQIFPVPIAVLT